MSLTLHYFGEPEPIDIKIGNFPAGESYVQIDTELNDYKNYVIRWNYQSDVELFTLGLLMQTVSQKVENPIFFLGIPYFPHSRMDRVTSKELSFSLKVFINILQSYSHSFDIQYIETYDLHSPVADKLLKYIDILNIPQEDLLDIKEEELILVSPDSGAWEKTNRLAYFLEATREHKVKILKGTKNRDSLTGVISNFEVEEVDDIYTRALTPIYIVDDICDGGGTFLGLYWVLREMYPLSPIHLLTTHGIYSKGVKCLERNFASVSCYNLLENNNKGL